MNICFAKTRHWYDSYTDFWRLVDLSGFNKCYFDEINFQDTDTVYITSPCNGEHGPHIRNNGLPGHRGCKIVHWLLERPDAPGINFTSLVSESLSLFDACWVSDRLVASLDSRVRYITLGGHKGLYVEGNREPIYDFTHQSYSWGRREAIYNQLKSSGLREGPSCFGPEREIVLASSRIVLNLQQYSLPVTAPLRQVLAAAYSKPFLSEKLHAETWPLVRGVNFIDVDYGSLVTEMFNLRDRSHDNYLSEIGSSLHEQLCVKWTFRHCVEEAVQMFLEGK